eukprot:Gb_25463 [translate_table: standard]
MAFVSVVKCMVAPQCGIPRTSMHRCSASSIHGAKLQFETAKSHRVFMTATLPSKSEEVEEVKKPFNPRKSDGRVTHSMEIFKSLENWAESNVLVNLKPVERGSLTHLHESAKQNGSYETRQVPVPPLGPCGHGDLLNKYVYLGGRVDMRQIEKTIQYLIGSGMA